MSNRVLIIIDFFNPNGFSETPRLAGPALVAARRTAALKVRLRRARVPVIYANDNFGQWQSNFSMLVAICKGLSGEAGQIADMLAPRPADWSLLKPRHSAFFGTPLVALLDDLDADTLILLGVSAESCVWMTACDAHTRGIGLVVPVDTMAGVSAPALRATVRSLHEVLGARTPARAASLRFANARIL